MSCKGNLEEIPCTLQQSLRGNLGPYVMIISCRYECRGNPIFGPVNHPDTVRLLSDTLYVDDFAGGASNVEGGFQEYQLAKSYERRRI